MPLGDNDAMVQAYFSLGTPQRDPGDSRTCPDRRTGAVRPRVTLSVREISTCPSFRSGPRTATLGKLPLGPRTSTRSWQTNCPGWDRGRLGSQAVAEEGHGLVLGQMHVAAGGLHFHESRSATWAAMRLICSSMVSPFLLLPRGQPNLQNP